MPTLDPLTTQEMLSTTVIPGANADLFSFNLGVPTQDPYALGGAINPLPSLAPQGPVMSDSTPSLLAQQAFRQQLGGVLVAGSSPMMFVGGGDAPEVTAPSGSNLEPVSLSVGELGGSGGVPDTVAPSATGPFGNVPPSLTSNSGVLISATPGQTTTILGRFEPDMNNIINEQLEYPQTTDFGAKPGGYNVLNVDTTLTGDAFWDTYNQPFLDAAVSRGDPIPMATPVTYDSMYRGDGTLTGYGREVQYLTSQGYSYDPLSGTMYKH
jgi:hypothetical protein